MKWSELPKEYRDLENTFDKSLCDYNEEYNNLVSRFIWCETPQDSDFWFKVFRAKKISELPEIPKNDK